MEPYRLVTQGTIAKAERQVRPLLLQAGYVIEPAGTRLGTLDELAAYASSHEIELTPKAKPAGVTAQLAA